MKDKRPYHHKGLFLLLSTLIAMSRHSEGGAIQTKEFVIACYDTGIWNIDITVKISGITSDETLVVSNFIETSSKSVTANDNISYGFKSYKGSFESNKTCAYFTAKSMLGSHFVNVISSFNFNRLSDKTIQVTYEANHMFEGYTAIPIENLGLDYYAVTYCEVFGQCQIFIVAIDDIRSINITLPNTQKIHGVIYGGNFYNKGDVISTSLISGESMLIECECDMTGTHIAASEKVAVFSGSRDAFVGVKEHKNFLIEQLPPFNKWGMEYACSCQPYCNKYGAFIRVIARQRTTIHISGYMKVKTTSAFPWIHRRIEKDDSVYITADKPVLVMMFLLSDETQPSSMFLVPPITDQANRIFFQFPTENFENMKMTVMSSDVLDYSVNKAPVNLQHYFYFQGSQLFASMIKFPDDISSKEVIIERNGSRFGVIGVFTGAKTSAGTTDSKPLRIGFALGSYHNLNSQTDRPAFPGDGVDTDKDGLIDEDDCTINDYANTFFAKDCRLEFGSDMDEKGNRFFVTFPYFDAPTRFTVDIMSNISIMYQPAVLQHGLSQNQCLVRHEETPEGSYFYLYEDECLRMGVNLTGVVSFGTELLFQTEEVTVSVSIYGAATMATYMALPVDVLGLEYYAVTYCSHGGYCACAVSTTYDSTNVFIKLPSQAGAIVGEHSYTAGSVIRQMLAAYQTLMFASTDDLTGTYIQANAPVAVVCGGNSSHGTYLEQMPPVLALGLSYMIPMISDILIRVVATDGNTIVTGYGTVNQAVLLSSAGSRVNLDTALSIRSVLATKPVLVVIVYLNRNADGCMSVLISNSHLTQRHYAKLPTGVDTANVYLQLQEGRSPIAVKDYNSKMNVWDSFEADTGTKRLHGYSVKMSDPQFPFLSLMFGSGENQNSHFCTSIGRKVFQIEEVCSPTVQNVGDGIDNDCDGIVDEDIAIKNFYKDDTVANVNRGTYILDFDLDGIMDEDCFSEITVTSSTEMYSTSETFSMEPSTTMTAETFSLEPSMTTTAEPFSLEPSTMMTAETFSLESSTTMTAETFSLESSMTTTAETFSLEPSTTMTAESSANPTEITTTAVASVAPSMSKCYCPCALYKPPDPAMMNITKEKLVSIVEITKKKLAVNKTFLSSYIRKKNSAKDSRPSAAGVGSFGIIILVLLVVLMVGLDLVFLKHHLESVRRYKF